MVLIVFALIIGKKTQKLNYCTLSYDVRFYCKPKSIYLLRYIMNI